jgi:hypothetical protein
VRQRHDAARHNSNMFEFHRSAAHEIGVIQYTGIGIIQVHIIKIIYIIYIILYYILYSYFIKIKFTI